MKVLFSIYLAFISSFICFSQQAYKDQITLKNDSVYTGLVIEQIPGKQIKLYRESYNDTLEFNMTDIQRLNKIFEPRNQKPRNKQGK